MRLKTKPVGRYQTYPFHKWSYKYPKKKRLSKKAARNESFNEDFVQRLLLKGGVFEDIGCSLILGGKMPKRWRLLVREDVKGERNEH